MTLTDEDLALLRAEGCLVDAAAAQGAIWAEVYGEDTDDYRRAMRSHQSTGVAALRSQRLTPGRPSLDLLVAAIERRGWVVWDLFGPDGPAGRWSAAVRTDKRNPAGDLFHSGRHFDPDPATALALAFLAALRAAEGTDGR